MISFKEYLIETADEEKSVAYDAELLGGEDVNYYYISSGKQTRMYTLRHAYTDYMYDENDERIPYVRDDYVRNLSTDWDKAISKAVEYLGNRANLLDIGNSFTLDEIRRRNAEEMEKYRRQKEKEAEERLNAWVERGIQEIEAGYWPFGKYKGEKFEDAPKSYIKYIATKIQPDEGKRGNVMHALQATLKNKFPEIFNAPEIEIKNEYFGEPGKRYTFNATVDRISDFEGYYGWVYIIKMIKDTGEILVYKGGNDYGLEEGDKVSFKGTVKDHNEYKGEKQTIVQRLKILK